MKTPAAILSIVVFFFSACSKSDPGDEPPGGTGPIVGLNYYPPNSSSEWRTTTSLMFGSNPALFNDLDTYLQQKNTKAFIILKGGYIAYEKYYGSFTVDSNWYWASAGKTMTGFLVGIAQQEGSLNINNKTSQYLGTGWTSLSQAKEDLITVRHQLTMTTGLDDGVPDNDCTLPSCLQYKSDAGTRWAYHNAPYTMLDKVVENATGRSYNTYFQEKIRDKIGMNGFWIRTGYNNVYYSTPRSMARFGMLLLSKGNWDGMWILNDTNYFKSQIATSQNFNPSYGYLTWLNGKSNYMLPGPQFVFNGPLVPNAPADMYSALGKNDQKIYVVPSQNIVVIRMGESAGNVQLAMSGFDNELWGKLKPIIGY